MTAVIDDTTQHSSPFGSDTVRAKLRNALVDHFHSQGPASVQGFHRWSAPSAQQSLSQQDSVKLLVGDPIALAENLKILKQYSKLLSQACTLSQTIQTHDPTNPLPAHAQPLCAYPSSFPRNLQWFETLARPYTGLDEAGTDRISQLLQLHAACDQSVPALPRQQAYELAKSLPHFDRDLTAFYLALPIATDSKTHHKEYELHVAHSIMRLHSPASVDDLHQKLFAWRNQGLLHVLSVAALNMPDLSDWFPGEPLDKNKDSDACSLHECLRALDKTPRDYSRTLEDFIATQDPAAPTAQAIAGTLDRLAILMSVKSNAAFEPDHDLAASLASFPRLDTLEPHDLWARIKPALEKALPPSILRVDPNSSCVRKRVRKHPNASSANAVTKRTSSGPTGSWCVPLTHAPC